MRIRVSKDMNFMEAFDAVINFLESNMDESPYLRTDMYIYLSLKTADGKVCVSNDRDYYYDGNRMIDTVQDRIDQGKKMLLTLIHKSVRKRNEAINEAEERLKRYKKNLRNAMEKGFTTADKWRDDIEDLKSKIEGEYSEEVRTAQSLQKCLDANDVVFHIQTKTDSYNKVVSIRILVEIDPDSRVFDQPVYYVPEVFSYEKPEYLDWFEA